MDIITLAASNLFAEQLRELYRERHVVAESEAVHKNGSCMPIELSMSFIEYRGKPAILSIIRDIQERKKAERMLKCERDRAHNYLDIAGTIIIAIDEEQKKTNQVKTIFFPYIHMRKGLEMSSCPGKIFGFRRIP